MLFTTDDKLYAWNLINFSGLYVFDIGYVFVS